MQLLQHEVEFEQLLAIYRHTKPLKVLEIGSFHGGSLYHFLTNAVDGAFVCSVDLPPSGTNQSVWTSWVPVGVTLLPIRGDSRDPSVIREVEARADYDFVFIDAGHRYGEVRADWINYGSMVEHGVIALHDIVSDDIFHPEIEVKKLWREIRESGELTQELIEDPDAPWGGIGVVYR